MTTTRRSRIVKRTVMALAVVLLAAALLPVARDQWYELRDGVPQAQFDPVAWKRADPNSATQQDGWRTVRSRMIRDLLRRYDFKGWTRRQVNELLGDPTCPGQEAGFPQFEVIYLLGLERGGWASLDDEALGFNFDSTDRVSNYGLSVN